MSTAPMAIPALAPVERPDEEEDGVEREEGVEAPPAVNVGFVEANVGREVGEEGVGVITEKAELA